MALRKHINPRSILNPDTGFGTDPNSYGGRFLNRDGSFNIIRKGVRAKYRVSIFQKMIAMPVWQFAAIVFLVFVGVNLAFALVYYCLGAGEFVLPDRRPESVLLYLVHLFFYSVQALTTVTVDYRQIIPRGFWASMFSSFEALCGLMSFAILTGLVYSRFARPRSFLLFSRHALVSPYRTATGLMFRMVSYKDRHNLIDVNVRVNLGLTLEENGVSTYKFFSLPLERDHIDSLNMNWTVVHPIDEHSPLRNFTRDDLEQARAEIFIQVTGFDEVFSATIVRSTSYFFNEIIYGAKFKPMYYESEDDTTTILELDKLDDYVKASLAKEEGYSHEFQ